MIFCNNHRLPENHKCPFDLRHSTDIEDRINRSQVIYQDALDFMDKELTVAKIYEYVTTRRMDDMEAIDLLTFFLENSDNPEMQVNTILAFKVLQLKNNVAFQTLERCILSEEDSIVKNAAVDVVRELFPKESKNLIEWVNKQKNIKET